MHADPEVKLSGFGAGGRPRLSVRFHTLDPLLQIYKQVRDNGVFSVTVSDDQPTALQLQVLFRTRRRGEEFPATILTWSRGLAVLQPNVSVSDFKELTGSLVVNLSNETGKGEEESAPLKIESRRAPQDTLQELQQTGARIQAAAALRKLHRTQEDSSGTPIAVQRRGPDTPITPEDTDPHRAVTRDLRAAEPRETPREQPVLVGRTTVTPEYTEVVRPDPGPGRLIRDDSWMTASGSFARIPTGMARVPGGEFERVPSALVPAEAYRFLELVRLIKPAAAEGSGTGSDALSAVGTLEDPPLHSLLGVSPPEGDRSWYLFYERDTLVTGYLRPVSAVTALPTLLCRQGLITMRAAEEAFRFAEEHVVPEETALEEVGAADSELLRKALRAKVKLLLSLLRSERQVRWTLWALEGPLALPGLVDLETEQARFASLLERYEARPLSELLAANDDRMGHYPTLRGEAGHTADLLGLDASTRHFLTKCLGGEHTLRQLPQVSSLGRQRSYSVTFALVDLGYVELHERDTTELENRRFLRRLEVQHEKLGEVHDFDFIAVHWSASEREVMQAVSKLVAEFTSGKLTRFDAEHREKASAIVAEARRIRDSLATLEARRQYRGEILDPFAVDQAVELLLSNLDMSIYRRDSDEIHRILGRLKELDPAAALKARARLPKNE